MRVGPPNHEGEAAGGAAHGGRALMQRRPGTATRAHAVSRAPARRWSHGAAQSQHNRPHARPDGEYLEESARNGEWPPVDVEDRFGIGELHDAVPCPASQRAGGPGPQSGPLLYLVHARPPERSWPAAAPRAPPPRRPPPPPRHAREAPAAPPAGPARAARGTAPAVRPSGEARRRAAG